jgi:hypothetical protein
MLLLPLQKSCVDRPETTAAIVGAAGSIGRGISLLLSETVPRLILIGNPNNQTSSDRLHQVAAEIYRYQSALLQQGRLLNRAVWVTFLPAALNCPARMPMDEFEAFTDGEGSRMGLIEFQPILTLFCPG